MSEPDFAVPFREWLVANGGSMHPSLYYSQDPSGTSVNTAENLETKSNIISCPFSLAITPELSKRALDEILGPSAATLLEKLSERELVCTYLALHWVAFGQEPSSENSVERRVLRHLPYLKTFPAQDALQTPLYMNKEEFSLLAGTNLYHATLDRRTGWELEWQKCQDAVGSARQAWRDLFSWPYFRAASTYLSSRAFPSSLLSATPSIHASKDSHPVLLPGIDSLNHARGEKVTWVVSNISGVSGGDLQLSLVLDSSREKGQEVFNNYGLKSNVELILGYGFALRGNPEDTLVLKLGGAGARGQRHEIGRDGVGLDAVCEEIREAFLSQVFEGGGEEERPEEWEVDLEVADRLKEMMNRVATRLQETSAKVERAGGEAIRPEVLRMIQYYVEGQQDIAEAALKRVEMMWTAARNAAKELEVEFDTEEEE